MPDHESTREVFSISGYRRAAYADGQLLQASDLQDEQTYFLNKIYQQNRARFDAGVIKGLELTSSDGRITVGPGFAMDQGGRILELVEAVEFDLPHEDGRWSVYLELVEEKCQRIPALQQLRGDPGFEFANIVEVTKLLVRKDSVDARDEDMPGCVLLGRLQVANGSGSREAATD